MRAVTDAEMKVIEEKKCPRCQSMNIDIEFMRLSLDAYCNDCGLSWSAYTDGKVVIW